MRLTDKVFWPVFIIVFAIVSIFIFNSTYYSKIMGTLDKIGVDTSDLSREEIMKLIEVKKSNITVHDNLFVCENNNSVKSRAYVILLGFDNHDMETFSNETSFMQKDPKVKGTLVYDFNETKFLYEISQDFISKINEFLSKLDIEELVIIGSSAGGNIAAYSINQIDYPGRIELHTIASPLKGYGLEGIKERLAGDMSGFEREIAVGFEPFEVFRGNIRIYHHKTVNDNSLLSRCGSLSKMCNTLEIQNNNMQGSKDFYYKDFDHKTIMHEVLRKIIDCRK